jgi:hypothetical protein
VTPASTVGVFFATNFIQNLYTVLKKKIVGISQYAYFNKTENKSFQSFAAFFARLG